MSVFAIQQGCEFKLNIELSDSRTQAHRCLQAITLYIHSPCIPWLAIASPQFWPLFARPFLLLWFSLPTAPFLPEPSFSWGLKTPLFPRGTATSGLGAARGCGGGSQHGKKRKLLQKSHTKIGQSCFLGHQKFSFTKSLAILLVSCPACHWWPKAEWSKGCILASSSPDQATFLFPDHSLESSIFMKAEIEACAGMCCSQA